MSLTCFVKQTKDQVVKMPDALARTQDELDAWKEEEAHWRSVNERQKTVDRIQKEDIPDVQGNLDSARSEAANATGLYEKVRLPPPFYSLFGL